MPRAPAWTMLRIFPAHSGLIAAVVWMLSIAARRARARATASRVMCAPMCWIASSCTVATFCRIVPGFTVLGGALLP